VALTFARYAQLSGVCEEKGQLQVPEPHDALRLAVDSEVLYVLHGQEWLSILSNAEGRRGKWVYTMQLPERCHALAVSGKSLFLSTQRASFLSLALW
jgi:hypothetical protein